MREGGVGGEGVVKTMVARWSGFSASGPGVSPVALPSDLRLHSPLTAYLVCAVGRLHPSGGVAKKRLLVAQHALFFADLEGNLSKGYDLARIQSAVLQTGAVAGAAVGGPSAAQVLLHVDDAEVCLGFNVVDSLRNDPPPPPGIEAGEHVLRVINELYRIGGGPADLPVQDRRAAHPIGLGEWRRQLSGLQQPDSGSFGGGGGGGGGPAVGPIQNLLPDVLTGVQKPTGTEYFDSFEEPPPPPVPSSPPGLVPGLTTFSAEHGKVAKKVKIAMDEAAANPEAEPPQLDAESLSTSSSAARERAAAAAAAPHLREERRRLQAEMAEAAAQEKEAAAQRAAESRRAHEAALAEAHKARDELRQTVAQSREAATEEEGTRLSLIALRRNNIESGVRLREREERLRARREAVELKELEAAVARRSVERGRAAKQAEQARAGGGGAPSSRRTGAGPHPLSARAAATAAKRGAIEGAAAPPTPQVQQEAEARAPLQPQPQQYQQPQPQHYQQMQSQQPHPQHQQQSQQQPLGTFIRQRPAAPFAAPFASAPQQHQQQSQPQYQQPYQQQQQQQQHPPAAVRYDPPPPPQPRPTAAPAAARDRRDDLIDEARRSVDNTLHLPATPTVSDSARAVIQRAQQAQTSAAAAAATTTTPTTTTGRPQQQHRGSSRTQAAALPPHRHFPDPLLPRRSDATSAAAAAGEAAGVDAIDLSTVLGGSKQASSPGSTPQRPHHHRRHEEERVALPGWGEGGGGGGAGPADPFDMLYPRDHIIHRGYDGGGGAASPLYDVPAPQQKEQQRAPRQGGGGGSHGSNVGWREFEGEWQRMLLSVENEEGGWAGGRVDGGALSPGRPAGNPRSRGDARLFL